MAWFSDLAGRAEVLLNKIDTGTAQALGRPESRSLPSENPCRPEFQKSRVGMSYSASVPAGLNQYAAFESSPESYFGHSDAGNGDRSLASLKVSSDIPISSSRLRAKHVERALVSTDKVSDKEVSGLNKKSKKSIVHDAQCSGDHDPSGQHSRHSSASSASSYLALSGRNTPGSSHVVETGSTGSGSGGSASTDQYITIDAPAEMTMSFPSSSGSSNFNGGSLSGMSPLMVSLESESALLKTEITNLNQEMCRVLKRAKCSENESKHLKNQMTSLSHQLKETEALLRGFQDQENNFKERINVKDEEISNLKIKLKEADKVMETHIDCIEELEKEKMRVVDGAAASGGVHSCTVESLQGRISELEELLTQEKGCSASALEELQNRIGALEEDKRKLASSLSEEQIQQNELQAKNHSLNLQVASLKSDLVHSEEELSNYKVKASRILQSKDKLIASLKEGNSEKSETSEGFLQAELEQTKIERNHAQEELDKSNKKLKEVLAQMVELEAGCREEVRMYCQSISSLESSLIIEKSKRQQAEQELKQMADELCSTYEDLSQHKVNAATRVEEREVEIARLQKQLAHKQTSSYSQQGMENRIQSLTELLVQKQSMIEGLSTEKHSLSLQLEKLQKQYGEAQAVLNQEHTSTYHKEEVRSRVPPVVFAKSLFDSGMTRRVRRVYSSVDRLSVRLGLFLRWYPLARVFIVIYIFILHVWVLGILLTYTPEIHHSDYNFYPPGTHQIERKL